MIKQVLHILCLFSFILVFQRCAQQVELTGGKRDAQPPKLLEAVPLQNELNAKPESIILKFDEYVQIKDLSSQLIVSPNLKTPPEITAEGKKIIITLKKEELLPNTTYRLFFGKSIADLNESNSIDAFEYVFSTGSYIDTLKVGGSVSDAFNNKPVVDVVLALYYKEGLTDSLPYKKEPDYLARSNESGGFNFRNLPYRTFIAYAFDDKNKNKLYDGETEKIAFLDDALQLRSDSNITLKLFQEDASKSFIKKTSSPYYGLTQIFLNKRSRVSIAPLNAGDRPKISETFVGKEKDTVQLYYKDIQDTLPLVFQNLENGKTDTLNLVLPKKSQAKKPFKGYSLNLTSNQLALNDKLRFTFLNWMDTTKSVLTKLKLRSKEDSLIASTPVSGRWRSITSFELDIKLKEGMNYSLKVDTGAFFDANQLKNDSMTSTFRTQSKLDFGKLILKLRLNKKQNYIVQLINEQGAVIKEQFISFALSSSNAVTLDFTDVLPGTYTAKIIFDDNGNKKWDTGRFMLKKQPERVIMNSKQLKILSDWEIEEEILIKD